jgi:adenylosuccinate lyase
LIDGLLVHADRMRRNLDSSHGLYHSGAVLLALARHGVLREEAYAAVQKVALRCWQEESDFAALVREDAQITGWLNPQQLADCFDLGRHLAHVDAIFERVLAAR